METNMKYFRTGTPCILFTKLFVYFTNERISFTTVWGWEIRIATFRKIDNLLNVLPVFLSELLILWIFGGIENLVFLNHLSLLGNRFCFSEYVYCFIIDFLWYNIGLLVNFLKLQSRVKNMGKRAEVKKKLSLHAKH